MERPGIVWLHYIRFIYSVPTGEVDLVHVFHQSSGKISKNPGRRPGGVLGVLVAVLGWHFCDLFLVAREVHFWASKNLCDMCVLLAKKFKKPVDVCLCVFCSHGIYVCVLPEKIINRCWCGCVFFVSYDAHVCVTGKNIYTGGCVACACLVM
jgi:hypothetical protein